MDHVICYVNAGGGEDFRPDQAAFPKSVVGKKLDGAETPQPERLA